MDNLKNLKSLTRRQIRYLCFRLLTEAEGGAKAHQEKDGLLQYVNDVKKHFQDQDDFGGWLKFAKTWDVDDKAPLVAVPRTSSIQTEWGKILQEETKEMPASEEHPKLLGNKLAEKVQAKKAEVKKTRARFQLD